MLTIAEYNLNVSLFKFNIDLLQAFYKLQTLIAIRVNES